MAHVEINIEVRWMATHHDETFVVDVQLMDYQGPLRVRTVTWWRNQHTATVVGTCSDGRERDAVVNLVSLPGPIYAQLREAAES
jgi:hypothetical protein